MLPAFGVIIDDVLKLLRLIGAKNAANSLNDSENSKKYSGNLVVDNALTNINKNDYLNNIIKVNDGTSDEDDNVSKEDLVNRLNNLKNK